MTITTMTKYNYQFFRKIVRIILLILGIVTPFIKIDGKHLLIFDIFKLEFNIFGLSLQINQFLPLLIFFLFLTFLFLYLTVTFGRIWCGWLCPQSVMMETTSFMDKLNKKSGLNKIFNIIILFVISAFFAGILLLYFIPYEIFFKSLFTEHFSKPIFTTLLILTVLLFLNFLLVRYRFCATVCPYSMLQSMLFDKHTLAVWMIPERKDECINCLKCVNVCSTNIDIREGQNSACINCAKCIDACREVMARFGKKSLFAYRFGQNNEKNFTRFSSVLTLALTIAAFSIFLFLAFHVKSVQIEVIPNSKFLPRYVEDYAVNRYTLIIENNTNTEKTFTVKIENIPDYKIVPDGIFTVKPHHKEHFHFFIKVEENLLENTNLLSLRLLITDQAGEITAYKNVSFRKPTHHKRKNKKEVHDDEDHDRDDNKKHETGD